MLTASVNAVLSPLVFSPSKVRVWGPGVTPNESLVNSVKLVEDGAVRTEVPPKVKAEMERLAERHNRSLSGEVITALQEYIARQHRAEQQEGK
jgi:hypothetical protein